MDRPDREFYDLDVLLLVMTAYVVNLSHTSVVDDGVDQMCIRDRDKGYDVHGTIRRSSVDYRERIAHLEGCLLYTSSKEIVSEIEKHCTHFYIRANRCRSLYDDLFSLRGWKTEEINGIQFELNSILVEKWEGKGYRLVIQRQKRMDGELDLWEGAVSYTHLLSEVYEMFSCVSSLMALRMVSELHVRKVG